MELAQDLVRWLTSILAVLKLRILLPESWLDSYSVPVSDEGAPMLFCTSLNAVD
jgi:hypothetical protein